MLVPCLRACFRFLAYIMHVFCWIEATQGQSGEFHLKAEITELPQRALQVCAACDTLFPQTPDSDKERSCRENPEATGGTTEEGCYVLYLWSRVSKVLIVDQLKL